MSFTHITDDLMSTKVEQSHSGPSTKSWREIAAEKQADAYSKIPEAWQLPIEISRQVLESSALNVLEFPRICGLLSPAELEITEFYTATALRAKLATGELSAVEVAVSFCKRAAIAQQLTNCVTETMFPQALERATFLDNYFHHNGPMGPLHGLPISIKTADSHNNLFGRTLNPHNLRLTAGGSSGGEGAIVALRGSIIGVGTDIAGSIRIPALCCGDYGFKPSVGRIPYGGQTSCSRPGGPGIAAVAGPLTQSAEDLNLFFEAVLGAKPWDYDPTALAVSWRDVPFKKSLRLGFIFEDSAEPVSPPIARALKLAAKALGEAGHAVIPLEKFPSLDSAQTLAWRFFMTDPKSTTMSIIEDGEEPLVPSVAKASGFPTTLVSMDEFYDISEQRRDLKEKWLSLFLEHKLDAVMLPAYSEVAPSHDEYRHALYTVLANLLDYPAAVIPFLKADRDIDNTASPKFDIGITHGAPCSVQLMGRNLFDEELLAATKTVSDVLKAFASSDTDQKSNTARAQY